MFEGMPAGPHRWVAKRPLFAAINEVTSMQRFVAVLSTAIEKAEFERSWRSDANASHPGIRPIGPPARLSSPRSKSQWMAIRRYPRNANCICLPAWNRG